MQDRQWKQQYIVEAFILLKYPYYYYYYHSRSSGKVYVTGSVILFMLMDFLS